VESIDSGRLLSTYTESVDGLVDAYKAGYLEGGTFGTVFLSNVGNENYTKNIGPLRWSEFEYIYGQFIPGGAHFHITASTFDGSLALNAMFVSSMVPEHVAHAFVEAAKDHDVLAAAPYSNVLYPSSQVHCRDTMLQR
jgi:hypothetical protein